MSQESLILLDKPPFPASKGKRSGIQFITRTSFESIFPNKEVPVYFSESESFRLNKETHQRRKPILKLHLEKEDLQQQQRRDQEEDDEVFSYESYDPDDPDFEVYEEEVSDEDERNYEASEDENHSEENIFEEVESPSEGEEAESVESPADGVDSEEEVRFKTESEYDEEKDREIQRQELLFLSRKGRKAYATIQEVNKGKRYRLYHDWKILKAADYYAAKRGPSILKSEGFWENLKDPETGDSLLGSSRYSSSIFERYIRRLRYISEKTKEKIYKLVERLPKQDLLDYYCEFCTSDSPVCFVGIQKISEKSKYLLREAPQKEVIPQKARRQAPNHGYGTRATRNKRNVRLFYETDNSFTAGESADVSEISDEGEGEKETVSDYSEESSQSDLTNENILYLASASQPVYRAEESDFWSSPSLPKSAVRYGASQPLIEDEYSRETISRKRLIKMREKSSSLEIINRKRKADSDEEEEEYYQDFPLKKKIHTENIYPGQVGSFNSAFSALGSQRSSLEMTSRGTRKLRIDEDSQKDLDLNMLMLYVNPDSDKNKDSNLLKGSQNNPIPFLNT